MSTETGRVRWRLSVSFPLDDTFATDEIAANAVGRPADDGGSNLCGRDLGWEFDSRVAAHAASARVRAALPLADRTIRSVDRVNFCRTARLVPGREVSLSRCFRAFKAAKARLYGAREPWPNGVHFHAALRGREVAAFCGFIAATSPPSEMWEEVAYMAWPPYRHGCRPDLWRFVWKRRGAAP